MLGLSSRFIAGAVAGALGTLYYLGADATPPNYLGADATPPNYLGADATPPKPQRSWRNFFRGGRSSSARHRSTGNNDNSIIRNDNVGNAVAHNVIYNIDTGGGPVLLRTGANRSSWKNWLRFSRRQQPSAAQGIGQMLGSAAGAAGSAFIGMA